MDTWFWQFIDLQLQRLQAKRAGLACLECEELRPLNEHGYCTDCAAKQRREAAKPKVKAGGRCPLCGETVVPNATGPCIHCQRLAGALICDGCGEARTDAVCASCGWNHEAVIHIGKGR